jgi:hypothetical protein
MLQSIAALVGVFTTTVRKIIILFQRNNLWVAVNDNFAFVPAERFMQIAAQGVPLERNTY